MHYEGLSPYAIGKRLGRASNTIRNELKRGTVSQIKGNRTVMIYYPDTGQLVYESNRKNCGTKFKLLECEEFIQYVVDMFYEKKHSLDSICGRAQRNHKFSKLSIGSSTLSKGCIGKKDNFINEADQGLYLAKKTGRNKVCSVIEDKCSNDLCDCVG